MAAQGPPYPPRNQGLGGNPAVIPDVPVAAIFLVLYLIFGVIHIKILKSNKGRGHKFLFNGAILGMQYLVISNICADMIQAFVRSGLSPCHCG